MEHTHIIRASQFDGYADTRESQAVIPELIYLLVKQSISDPSSFRIPYGDSVNQPGWDGLVRTEEAFLGFVPQGNSYWEISAEKDPQDKATEVFEQRTAAGAESDRAEASFVFVTPRSGSRGWTEPNQAKWRESRKDRGWKLIRIIDGVKLADWLREFPSIGGWMAQKIGITPHLGGISTPREHWDLVVARGNTNDPPLPPVLFTAARSSACDALEAMFNGENRRLCFFAESDHDVEDFIAAYLASLDDKKESIYANRCLFISDEDAWRSVAEVRRQHVFVANPRLGLDSENKNLQTVAAAKGHAVIIPLCGAWSGESPEIIKLRSPSREQIEIILKEADYSNVRARELAAIGGDQISALCRHLLGLGTLPPYATWDSARQLAQAGLLGKWDGTNEADKIAIGNLLGKDYGEWIETLRDDVLRSGAPLIQRDEKWRLVVRGEAWSTLGNRITDEDLDRLQEMAVAVLGERNPKFDLPKEQRFAASIYGNQLNHSALLREGLVETLALIGSKSTALSSCSQGKAEATAILAVRRLLSEASWDRWASLDAHLPLLAEAAPGKFLAAVESVLVDLDRTPFHEIFSQEGGGVLGGWNYMTGLLWALETLAWNPDYLSQVAVILADIASIDPGGNWANRPSNSLADIFLPWHVQTTAPFEKRKVAIEAVLREQPDVGWKLLLLLLPHNYSVTIGCRQPTWRDYIPRDWKDGVSRAEYWDQVTAYAELMVEIAKESVEKAGALIEHLPDLPKPARENLLNHLASSSIVDLPESERLPLWDNLDNLVRKHRRFADAKWALSEEALLKIEEVANTLAPEAPALLYQRLFGNRDYALFEEEGNYDEQRKKLDEARQVAVQTMLESGGLQAVLTFARSVASPYEVGRVLGGIEFEKLETDILPMLLNTTEDMEKQVLEGFVWVRQWKFEWDWVDSVLESDWTKAQKAKFLVLLPFEEETWHRVANQLGEQDEGCYWQNVKVDRYGVRADLTIAIEKLLQYQRASAAVLCVCRTTENSGRFDESLAIRTLLAVLEEPSDIKHLDWDGTVEVIKRLQKSSTADQDALFKIEWNFLPWLNRFSPGSPVMLEKRLASDPAFFAEVVRLVFRSEKDTQDDAKPDEQRNNLARNAYRLLSEWRRCPGILADGSFNVDAFTTWLGEARRITEETGHGEVAQIQIGCVLTHAPSDPNGLWIHEAVAKALNGKDTGTMRSGFTTELFNQREVHGFTAGKEELELAQKNRDKAADLEAKGFSRFATAMREFAHSYERDAEREANRDPYND